MDIVKFSCLWSLGPNLRQRSFFGIRNAQLALRCTRSTSYPVQTWEKLTVER